MTVRFSPSLVSYVRLRRRPLTSTRVPRVSDSATFSAASRQTEQRMKRVSPSFHSFDWRSTVRGVEATVKLATAAPEGVNRSSGSLVRLPMMVMTVSPAMLFLPAFVSGRLVGFGADQLGRQDRLVQVELPVEFLGQVGLGLHVDDRVDALGLLLDLVGQLAAAPDVDVLDRAAALADDVEEPVERGCDRTLLEFGVEDDHQLVVTHAGTHLLWSGRSRSFRDRRAVRRRAVGATLGRPDGRGYLGPRDLPKSFVHRPAGRRASRQLDDERVLG